MEQRKDSRILFLLCLGNVELVKEKTNSGHVNNAHVKIVGVGEERVVVKASQ